MRFPWVAPVLATLLFLPFPLVEATHCTPGVPQNLTVTATFSAFPGAHQFDVDWDPPVEACHVVQYKVEQVPSGGGPFFDTAWIPSPQTDWTNAEAAYCLDLEWRVRAESGNFVSAYTPWTALTMPDGGPSHFGTDMMVVSNTPPPGETHVAWAYDPPAPNGCPLDGFNVYRKTSTGPYGVVGAGVMDFTGPAPRAWSYHDLGERKACETYTYKVRGTSNGEEGLDSQEVSASMPPGPPGVVQNGSAQWQISSVHVDWDEQTKNVCPVTSYDVHRDQTRTANPPTYIGSSAPGTNTEFDDPGPLQLCRWYYYRIRAIGAFGAGPIGPPIGYFHDPAETCQDTECEINPTVCDPGPCAPDDPSCCEDTTGCCPPGTYDPDSGACVLESPCDSPDEHCICEGEACRPCHVRDPLAVGIERLLGWYTCLISDGIQPSD